MYTCTGVGSSILEVFIEGCLLAFNKFLIWRFICCIADIDPELHLLPANYVSLINQ